MSGSADGAMTRRRAAVVAYWAAAVLFVADVAVVQEWLAPPPASTEASDPAAQTTADATEGPAETTITLAGGARLTFPDEPTESSQVLLIAGTDTILRLHTAEGPDGTTYNIGEIEYPPQVNLSDPVTNLIASISGAAGNVNGRIVERDITEYQGVPAVDFTVEADDVQLRARHVLDGRRLLAQNIAFRGAEPDDADDFFDSLELDPEDAAPTASPSPSPTDTP